MENLFAELCLRTQFTLKRLRPPLLSVSRLGCYKKAIVNTALFVNQAGMKKILLGKSSHGTTVLFLLSFPD